LLDTYYLTFEFLIALTWHSQFARLLAIALFIYRLAGVGLYIITKKRRFLFYFMNIFEYFFIIFLVYFNIYGFEMNSLYIIYTILILIPVKFVQEYILHYKQYKLYESLKENYI
jgi:hypothetical protein